MRFQVKYKSFDQIEEDKKWWKLPILTEFLRKNGVDSALKSVIGSEPMPARQFVEYAFGQLKSFNDSQLMKELFPSGNNNDSEGKESYEDAAGVSDTPSPMQNTSENSLEDTSLMEENNLAEIYNGNTKIEVGHTLEPVAQVTEHGNFDKHFWKNFANVISNKVVQKLGLPDPGKLKWDSFDFLNKVGLQSRQIAEAGYIESGLATPVEHDVDHDKASTSLSISAIQSSLPDVKKATKDLLRQTDSVLGAFMVVTAALYQLNKEKNGEGSAESKEKFTNKLDDTSQILKSLSSSAEGSVVDEIQTQEMKELFSTAETAMEAWAMLATSVGHPSFIKSEFEKICFLDNESTDTQVSFSLFNENGLKSSFPSTIFVSNYFCLLVRVFSIT